MKQLSELLIQATDFLKDKGVSHARRVVEQLLSEALQMKRLDLYLNGDRPLHDREIALFREMIKRALDGEPVEYIIGFVDFMGAKIEVNQNVLIPRPETELLLERALEGGVVWDICCGSGCLGIGYKQRFPNSQVILSDVCEKALAVASKNSNGLECRLGDLLGPFAREKADVVLCNPPYIRDDEYEGLSEGVKQEPKKALISGPTGLEFYKRLAHELPGHLNDGAQVYFELGTGQGADVAALFTASCWSDVLCEQDYSGHDRFFSVRYRCLES